MADVADIANSIEEDRLNRIMQNREKSPTTPSALFCEECDCEIPKLRRELISGVKTCVDCQHIIELKARTLH